ncbi:MAG TPA: RluA family pseudouridine synthase [Dongiaceae bacterium]|jgi:23S rRNA pseudouridine1911/1915/1917 synthase|nr:RluA family pseudouridine synthase [Dongiaceae bacterium]
MDTKVVTISAAQAGERLDRILAATTDLSRSRLKQLIEAGHVEGPKTDRALDPAHKARVGETYTIHIPPPIAAAPEPHSMALSIIFEDEDIVVIDKPAGLVVHPAPGHHEDTLVNALLAHCGASLSGIGGVRRPGIVHRIDKDTSGLIVAAKNDEAHRHLSELFAQHAVAREYQAVIWGVPSPAEGVVSGNIGRHRTDRKRMAVLEKGGRAAVTHYALEQSFGLGAALVRCRLQTGRTHQIRVHMAAIGHPLIGDPVYGRTTSARRSRLDPAPLAAALTFPRQALHASHLGFPHPRSGALLQWDSSLPQDMRNLINSLAR